MDFQHHLLSLLNRLLVEVVSPSQWKDSFIIPVLKPEADPQVANSYCPISLTNVMCKLLERMVSGRLMWILEDRGLLASQQGAFHQGQSTP